METGQHYSPNIVVEGNTYVIHEYCTHYLENGQCVERMQVVPYESLKNQSIANTEGYSKTAMFILVIMFLIRLIKGIFRLILPSKGKK